MARIPQESLIFKKNRHYHLGAKNHGLTEETPLKEEQGFNLTVLL